MPNDFEKTIEHVSPAEEFRIIVEDTLSNAGVTDKDREGNLSVPLKVDGLRLAYTAYEQDPQVFGRQILWGINFIPTYGLDIALDDKSYLFVLRDDDPTVITRRFQSGALIAKGGGLADLHVSTRPLDEEEAEALLLFARTPHVHLGKLAILCRLNQNELVARQANEEELRLRNKKLSEDLAVLAQQRGASLPEIMVL